MRPTPGAVARPDATGPCQLVSRAPRWTSPGNRRSAGSARFAAASLTERLLAADARSRSPSPRRGHVRTAACSCWSTPIAGEDAGLPHRPTAAKPRSPLSGRSAEGRGDHLCHVHGRERRARATPAWADLVLWRAGLRIQEALALVEGDLDHRRGALLVRRGKGGRRREVGMDTWGWDELKPWLELRVGLPVGPLFCVLNGRTRGRQWSTAAARAELRRTAAAAGVRQWFAPHQLRHRPRRRDGCEDVPLVVNQRQLGHSNLGITLVYLQGDRQRRDHRHRSRSPRADDPGQHVASALTDRRRSSRIAAVTASVLVI